MTRLTTAIIHYHVHANRSCCKVTRADSQYASKLKRTVSSDINKVILLFRIFLKNDFHYLLLNWLN